MGNSSLITKFQLDIFIFEELATYQTLLQSLKQNSNWSAQWFEGNNKLGIHKYLKIKDIVP